MMRVFLLNDYDTLDFLHYSYYDHGTLKHGEFIMRDVTQDLVEVRRLIEFYKNEATHFSVDAGYPVGNALNELDKKIHDIKTVEDFEDFVKKHPSPSVQGVMLAPVQWFRKQRGYEVEGKKPLLEEGDGQFFEAVDMMTRWLVTDGHHLEEASMTERFSKKEENVFQSPYMTSVFIFERLRRAILVRIEQRAYARLGSEDNNFWPY